MKDLFAITDDQEDRTVLVQANDKEEAIDVYFKWCDIDEDEIDDEDRSELEVQPVVAQQFSGGVMEFSS